MPTPTDLTPKLTAMTHLDTEDQALLHALELDWRRMCGNAESLAPATLDPVKLDAALPHAFVLRRVGPGAARFRVAGQRLHDLMQMDPRGMPISSFFSEAARETAMELMEAAFTLPAIVAIPLTAPRSFGRKPLRATALMLPMRDATGEMSRMLGAIITSGAVPRKALRFDIAHDVELRCEALEGRFPDRRAGSRAPEAKRPLSHAPAPTVQRGHLRLVVDNSAA